MKGSLAKSPKFVTSKTFKTYTCKNTVDIYNSI